MKQRVVISTYCLILTLLTALLLVALLIYTIGHSNSLGSVLTLSVLLLLVVFAALFYSPVSISVDDDFLRVHRPLKVKRIPLTDIESVQMCPPTMAEQRLCGSGGFFGYWGWFREPVIGKYFAYYGKASDCFLVKLKDGSQYLLGCREPGAMVDAISKNIGK